MCYGSGCKFENSMGECTVISDFNLFDKEYKVSPCAVGRSRAQLSEKDFNDEDIMQQIKGYTSKILREEFYQLQKMPSLWTRSYFVSTAGNVCSETIKQYVENQKKRY